MSVQEVNTGQEQVFVAQSSVVSAPMAETSQTSPARRGPGRPKGSGKKQQQAAQTDQPKMKRPVGRPRKDGLPAGSLSPPKTKRGPGRPRKNETTESTSKSKEPQQPASSSVQQPEVEVPANESSAPTTSAQNLSSPYRQQEWDPSAPSMTSLQSNTFTDPNDDWQSLLQNDHDSFLRQILTSISTLPSTQVTSQLEEYFKSASATLLSRDKDYPDRSVLYVRNGSFWLPVSSTFFVSENIGPGRKTNQRFFYWDPLPLVSSGIPCPDCTEYLIHAGPIRAGPIKVYDIGKAFFIIGCEYQCRSRTCTADGSPQKFASTDSRILQHLPDMLRNDFPAWVSRDAELSSTGSAAPSVWNWQALGISMSLYKTIVGCLQIGLNKNHIIFLLSNVLEPDQPIVDLQPQQPQQQQKQQQQQQRHQQTQSQQQQSQQQQLHQVPAQQLQQQSQQQQQPQRHSSASQHANLTEHVRPNSISNDTTAQWSVATNMMNTANSQGPHAMTQSSQSYSQAQPDYYSAPGSSSLSAPVMFVSTHPPNYHTPALNVAPAPGSYPYQPYGYTSMYPPAGLTGTLPLNGSLSVYPSEPSSSKRPLTQYAEQHVSDAPPPAKRTRHCSKCGSKDCKGKGGKNLCPNSCQDCGDINCPGRNSRYPNKRCQQSWT